MNADCSTVLNILLDQSVTIKADFKCDCYNLPLSVPKLLEFFVNNFVYNCFGYKNATFDRYDDEDDDSIHEGPR